MLSSFKSQSIAILGIAAAAVVPFSAPASAAVLTWSLQNVTFDDGGTATGSFNYDDTTNVYSNWNISVQGGNEAVYPPFNYNPSDSNVIDPGPNFVQFSSTSSPARSIDFYWQSSLKNPGLVLISAAGAPDGSAEGKRFITPGGSVVSGTLTTVPEPSNVCGGMLAALGCGWLLRRKLA